MFDFVLGILSFLLNNIWIVISGIFIALIQEPAVEFIRKNFRGIPLKKSSGTRQVMIVCSHSDARDAREVYVAGEFNEWLDADKGKINLSLWNKRKYKLEKVLEDKRVLWKKSVLLEAGSYNFKFVCGKSHWLSWQRNPYYLKGEKSPSGYNYNITVKK